MQRSHPGGFLASISKQRVARFEFDTIRCSGLCFHEPATQTVKLAGDHAAYIHALQAFELSNYFPVRPNPLQSNPELILLMMISTQTMICMSSSRLPQPGLCINSPVRSLVSPGPLRRRRGRGGLQWSSTNTSGFRKAGRRGDDDDDSSEFSARKSASASFVSSAETDASDDEVPAPAKDAAGMRNLTGTKTAELVMDPILQVPKLVSSIDDQLPPLLSMVIDGFPPLQQSKYVHEADKRLHQYAERYPNVTSLYSYCRVGLSSASYVHPGVISVDRLIAIAVNYALIFVLDDLFFDNPNEILRDQYGISRDACGSPQKIQEYLDYMNVVFSQQVQPCNPTPIESLIWEVGRDTFELSNPEWFSNYVACVAEYHRISVASHSDIIQGHHFSFQDLESYTVMRAANVGGKFIQLMIEFAKDTYIPGILRANPYLEDVTTATSIYIGFVNDVFSYYTESSLEQNPRNLITVLMECEGKPFVQSLRKAIGLVNTYARAIMDLEAEAGNSTLQNHLQDIKVLIAGSVYYSSMETRYRHPDSVFPELRDITSSWKILPNAEGLGL